MAVIFLGFGCTIAAGGTIYVDASASGSNDGSSWADAYNNLQDALYKPPTGGDQIWVAEGTYKPDEDEGANVTPNDRTETFQLINGVAIYGGFAGGETSLDERDWQTNVTILSGDLDGDDVGFTNNGENSYSVVTGSGMNVTAILDGFTITAGNASHPSDPIYRRGGGMYNDAGSPTVTNCTFTANSAYRGGGMCNWYNSSPTVTNCTFSGNSAGGHGGGMRNNSNSSPTLTNCTFSGNSANRGGGMYNYSSSSPTLTNCTFSKNSASSSGWGGGGMFNYTTSNPMMTNCTFSGNSATYAGGGMVNYHHNSPTLTNCTFSGNSAGWGGGGMLDNNGSPTFTNCTFSGNSAASFGGGMYSVGNSSPTMTNCILWGDTAGSDGNEIAVGFSSTIDLNYCDVKGEQAGIYNIDGTGTVNWGSGNIDADPLFVDADGLDDIFGTEDDNLRLLYGSPCIDTGDNAALPPDTPDLDGDGNTVEPIPWDLDGRDRFADGDCNGTDIVDMGAYEYDAGIIFVDADATGTNDGSNWANAYNYLQDALAGAVADDEIWVAEGTYKPDENTANPSGTGVRTATFQLINGVAIYGGFAGSETSLNERDWQTNETILSGDVGTQGVSGDNSYHVVTGSGTNNTALLDGFTITAGNASEAYPDPNSSGGGMYNDTGSPTVTNCTFSGNSAWAGGGMENWDNSSPTVTNCTFSGNSADIAGGGMRNENSSPTVTNCTFSGNTALQGYGGGIHNGSSSPTATNCTFSGNTAPQGYGGGMWNYNSSPTVTNCTFSSNSAIIGGGGMYNYESSPTLTNCTLWGDSPDEIGNFTSSPTVTYSDIAGGYTGTGNINADPLFVDADGDDNIVGTEDDNLQLLAGSPCIDAGDNTALPPDTPDLDGDGNTTEPIPWDLDGDPRFVDDSGIADTGNGTPPIVDMGAYEWYGGPYCGDAEHPYPPGDVSGPDGVRDCYVDFFDFAVFAAHWLECTAPECQ
ncbi:hypothetical protein ES707_12025 [subsurface metagenome]